MKDFLRAISFLTILPVGKSLSFGEKELARSMAFFPLVGLVIGLLLALGYHLLPFFLPRPLVLWLTIGLLAFLTRGLHLDGFADTMDGLASGGSRQKILEVMRDSRIGAFGVIGLILLIGAKYLSLNHISNDLIVHSLILMTVMGRNAMVLVCYRSPYARSDGGLGKPFAENLGIREVILASILSFGIVLWLTGMKGIVIFLGIGLFSFGYRFFFIKKLGGVTGDILGAANEVAELLCLLVLIILESIYIKT
ncbi:MAG: adenosylcobinamide-GDP ribazoletransferase [Deltaproteobacteria bacterium]|nr:adenosylcobinamide-GDP ribazoletransferase [Deltaproteobacteria bacterium]